MNRKMMTTGMKIKQAMNNIADTPCVSLTKITDASVLKIAPNS